MAVTQYNPEKLFEKMENNFVQALEKVCKQQADMFASKMEFMENVYRNSVKDTNDKLCKILETITTSVKPSNPEHVKFVSQIHSLENENHTLKTYIQDLRYKTELAKATLQSKLELENSKFEGHKLNSDKSMKQFQAEFESLRDKLKERDVRLRVVHYHDYVFNTDHYIGIVIANRTLLYKYNVLFMTHMR
jgi:uncharacterized protein (DUF342 family)